MSLASPTRQRWAQPARRIGAQSFNWDSIYWVGTVMGVATRASGRMALSPQDPANFGLYRAAALSVAPDNTSVALLEENQSACDSWLKQLNDCHTRVASYDTTTLARRSLRGLAPYERGDDRLRQWGRRMIHRADGSLIVMAEVRTRNEATPTWLLHRLSP